MDSNCHSSVLVALVMGGGPNFKVAAAWFIFLFCFGIVIILTGCPKVSTVRQSEFCPPRWAMFEGKIISNAAWEEVRWCRDLPNDRIDPKGAQI